METITEELSAAEVLEFYVKGVMDISNFGIAVLTKSLKEDECPIRTMETLENAKRGYMKIKRDGYLVSDFRAYKINNGFYNIREFLQGVCSNLNSYISGLFEVDIEYKIYEEDNVNMNFDAKLVEKAMYDSIFGLLCEAGVKKRRVSVYSRDLSKHIKICMRCEGARPNQYIPAEKELLFFGYGTEGVESYAEIAVGRLGGQYKCVYGSNECKVEFYIPKNLKLTQTLMKEEETKIVLGEKVMLHSMCDVEELEKMFGALKAR